MATLQIPSIKPSVITPVRDTPLIFSHPAIDRGQPFIIDTGASSIKWPYKLNVNVTPTYAGEVVQILSVYVDAMTLSGQTRDAEQLRSIYSWFLRYMQIAGLADRNQQAVTFQYPERGWQFLLQPTKLPNFTYNRDLLAVEWSLEAEIVQDDNILSGYTMNGFTRAAFDPSMWDVGFNAEDPRINPLSPFNSDPSTAQNLGNNFQSLIGAWSSGDFAHWAFDATQTPQANKLKNSKDYWTEVFGTDFLTKSKSGVNTGSAPYGGPLNPTGPYAIAAMIASIFEKHAVPGELGVAVSMQESSLDPNKLQGGADAPGQGGPGIGLFQVTGDGSGRDSSVEVQRAWTNHTTHKITDYYPAVLQAERAAIWFSTPSYKSSNLGVWGANAQAPADPTGYAAIVNGNLAKARAYIKKGQAATSLGPHAMAVAQTQIGYHESPPNSNDTKYGAEYGLNGQPWCIMFLSWCFKRANSSFHYAAAVDVVNDARAGRNGLSILPQPEPGCVAIYDFDSSHASSVPVTSATAQHGNFFQSWSNRGSTFMGLGGNQGGAVSVEQFNVSNVIAFVKVNT